MPPPRLPRLSSQSRHADANALLLANSHGKVNETDWVHSSRHDLVPGIVVHAHGHRQVMRGAWSPRGTGRVATAETIGSTAGACDVARADNQRLRA